MEVDGGGAAETKRFASVIYKSTKQAANERVCWVRLGVYVVPWLRNIYAQFCSRVQM